MVEEIATVVRSDSAGLWLTTTPVASCNACQVSDDCGTGIVAKTLTARSQQFFVPTRLNLLPGEQVKVGLSEQQLIVAALMVYSACRALGNTTYTMSMSLLFAI